MPTFAPAPANRAQNQPDAAADHRYEKAPGTDGDENELTSH
jgi:hypothetical protein